jgi:glycosyltransferase involved in cell wall biosynthesis
VRALNAIPGVRCVGVQFASSELTRGEGAADGSEVRTLAEGVYENLPRISLVRSSLQVMREVSADAAILDCPAEVVQLAVGRLLQRAGFATLIRWASTRQDYPRTAWRERAKRLAYRGWDGYLVTGARALEYLLTFGVNRDRAVVCGNPVEHQRFGAIRAEDPDHPRGSFLFVGRFIWHKNLERLLDAYAAYRASGGRFELRVAGDGAGPAASRIRERIRAARGVTHLGFMSAEDLAAEYGRAACLVLPSISENWGLVVNEAQYARLPVIVSDRCGCVPELVHEGESGLLVDPTSTEAITRALHRIEALGPVARASMGAAGRALSEVQTTERWADLTSAGVRAAIARRSGQ